MESCLIEPSQGKGESPLPPAGIFAVSPSDSLAFPGLAKRYHLNQQFLFHSKLFASPSFFLAGPAVGAPMAVICLEKLIALGARRIILYGWCGALAPSLKGGGLFVADSGISEEGTSPHYPPHPGFPPDQQLQNRLNTALERSGHLLHQGIIWTTDGLYRETRSKVAHHQEQGALAVDMEYTALSGVAAFRGAALATVMMVSDELYHQQWRSLVGRKSFRSASKKMLSLLCEELDSGGLCNP
ncbi:nucleoside phosphorylase [Desulfogranum mediterraneum]|uniref:nucleoside phosphorylase n=1 Tax=Desulfogranum mediterraneum TaxID=160661 RepID=UPI00048D7B42|nr:nucleoside phosphorylase [Desulfogranum mediterraneum]